MNNLLQLEKTNEKEVNALRLFISFVLIISTILFGKVMTSPPETRAEVVTPAYAKWGRIAMQKVKEKYEKANVIDYLHIGREIGEKVSTEKFKLWLREGEREFGVFVNIIFNNDTEEIIDIQFEETDR